MAKHIPVDQDHEDGSWFLEAVGAKERPPSPIESVGELERENTLVDTPIVGGADPSGLRPNDVEIELTSFSGDPGTSLSSFHPVPEPPPMPSNVIATTPLAVSRQIAPEVEPVNMLDDINDTVLSPALVTRRPFRWPSIVAAALVLAIIGIAVFWLPRAAEADAAGIMEDYYDASLDVRTFLPTAQASLDVVTRPTSTDDALGTVIPVISELSSHASNLESVAAAGLPATLPFVPRGAIDAVAPLRDRSAILAADTAQIAREIGHSYVYRTSIPQLFDVGELSSVATTDEINTISVLLASSLAENASLVADLPSLAAFDSIQSAANDAVSFYTQWQDEYLDALTSGDTEAAVELIAGLEAIRVELAVETAASLLRFREAMDDRMVSLAAEFDQHLNDLAP